MGWLVSIALTLPVYIGAGFCAIATLLVLLWRNKQGEKQDAVSTNESYPPGCDPRVLLASRITLFAGCMGFGVVRILFPKLGQHLGWADREIAQTIAFFLGGVAFSLLVSNLWPWWRGKFWPQPVAQGLMLLSGMVAVSTSSRIVLEAAFFVVGIVLALANTASLYHGLSGRKQRGKNTGIHESLIAGGVVVECLIGGVLAQIFSPRAPFALFSALSALSLVATITIYYTMRNKADV